MAFVAKISDPAHGATFMTLYNTVSNLGSAWPNAVALWLVDPLTIKSKNTLSGATPTSTTVFDGYYIETIACILIGFIWFFWGNVAIKKLQLKPDSSWRLENNNNGKSKDNDNANKSNNNVSTNTIDTVVIDEEKL